MTEYEIRLAVAEYDEDLAQLGDWEFGSELCCENESTLIECDVIGTHAQTMRAMDMAISAFNYAFGEPPK